MRNFFKVGDVIADGRYWGRAEEMDMDRPAKKVVIFLLILVES